MLPEKRSGLQKAQDHARSLAQEAVNEICEECFKDQGVEGFLKAVAALCHGGVLPRTIDMKLKLLAEKIAKAS